MSSETMKKNLNKVINNIDDDEKLKLVYELVEDVLQSDEYDFTEEELKILREDEIEYLSGRGKNYTWDEVKAKLHSK